MGNSNKASSSKPMIKDTKTQPIQTNQVSPKDQTNDHETQGNKDNYYWYSKRHCLFNLIDSMNPNDLKQSLLSYAANANNITNDDLTSVKDILSLATSKNNNNSNWELYRKAFIITDAIDHIYGDNLVGFQLNLSLIIAEYMLSYYVHIKRNGISVNNKDGFYDDLIFESKQLTLELQIKSPKLMYTGNPVLIAFRDKRASSAVISIHLEKSNCSFHTWTTKWHKRTHNAIDKNDDKWHHIALVIDDRENNRKKQEILYIDGEESDFYQVRRVNNALTRMDTSAIAKKQDICIAGYPSLPNNLDENMECFVKDIRVWNVARTRNQIHSFKNKVLSGNEHGLIGNWVYGMHDRQSNTKDKREINFTKNYSQFVY